MINILSSREVDCFGSLAIAVRYPTLLLCGITQYQDMASVAQTANVSRHSHRRSTCNASILSTATTYRTVRERPEWGILRNSRPSWHFL